MTRFISGVAVLLVSSFCVLSAHAALISGLSGQVVYDTDRNITFLANTNLAASETFGVGGIVVNGVMNVTKALEWLAAMNASDGGNGYLGFNAWRLPTTLLPDPSCTDDTAGMFPSPDPTGYNCTGGEMGHLFYEELGGTAGVPISESSDPDVALFSNFLEFNWYWTGTENPNLADRFYVLGWEATTNSGFQTNFLGTGAFIGVAWPVADGNPFGIIPIPAAAWLFASALGLLVSLRRRPG